MSLSELCGYAECPLQWRLSRETDPDFVPSGQIFSSCFRAALYHYYRRVREGREVPADELLDIFEEQWLVERNRKNGIPVRWGSTEKDEASGRALAVRMFRAFLDDRQNGAGAEVVAVGEAFQVDMGPELPLLSGTIDLIETRIDSDGVRRLHLVCFKTPSRRSTLEEIGIDRLHLYGLAAFGLGYVQAFQLPVAIHYVLITKTMKPQVLSITVDGMPKRFDRLVEKVRQCWHGVTMDVCYPVPSWRCAGCGFARQCADWPTGLSVKLPRSGLRRPA